MENYKRTIELKATADKIFNALSDKISLWWTELFEGSSNQKDNTFTVRFGDSIYKTMQVEEFFPDTRIVWYVTDSQIGIPELKNQTEWINTTIIWEITPQENTAKLELTHVGLNEKIECYGICANGWQQFTDSLKSYVQSGKGYPFRAVNDE